MAQVRRAYCDVAFAYAARLPGVEARDRLARYLKVSQCALQDRLRELNIKLPPMHEIISNDMSTFDFSVQRHNIPPRAARYGDPAAVAAELFPAVRDWLYKLNFKPLKATQPAKRQKTEGLTPNQRAEMHRSHMARCQDEAEKLIPELEVRLAFVLSFLQQDSGTGCNFINLGRNSILTIIYNPGARFWARF
jgi:hypothetical protein